MKIFLPKLFSLSVAVFLFFVLCCALNPASALYTHHLIDPDDYMRLEEVAAWRRGQSWYDLSVPRLSPDAHTVIHWSRLIDLPIAGVAQLFIPALGLTTGLLTASLIVPLLWFAVMMLLLPALAAPLTGKDRAGLATVMILFAPMLLFNYTPGRVDHHGVQAIIAGFGLYSLGQIISGKKARLFAVLAALGFACGFWIGTEALPWAMLFIACLGLAAAIQGKNVARDAVVFGLCLPLFTTAMLPLALRTSEFSSRALSWFSPAYALFAALAGGIFVIGWLVTRNGTRVSVRVCVYAALGVIAAVAFFMLIPSAGAGPFADYDAFDATTALDNITEAQPLMHALHINRFMPVTVVPVLIVFLRILLLPLIALMTCVLALRRTGGHERLVWLTHTLYLGAAMALTVFWQNRVGVFMEMFMLAPLAAFLVLWWGRMQQRGDHTARYWAEIIGIVVLAPLLVYGVPKMAKAVLHGGEKSVPLTMACDSNLDAVVATLNDATTLGGQRHTLMNISDTGPELLFLTGHNVVSGNFDVAGNADAYTFFHAFDDADAQAAARKWKADLVLVCRNAPLMYLGKDYYSFAHINLQAGKDGMLRLVNTDARQPLIARLNRHEIPAWLKPIEIPAPSDYLLFQIQDSAGQK